jgi:hypothetical protein
MYCHTNITTGSFRGVCTARTLILAASASRRRVFVLHVVFFFFFLTKETSAPPFWWRGAAEKKDMDFYGRDMAINNDLGIKLMSYLYLADADLTIVDYYVLSLIYSRMSISFLTHNLRLSKKPLGLFSKKCGDKEAINSS